MTADATDTTTNPIATTTSVATTGGGPSPTTTNRPSARPTTTTSHGASLTTTTRPGDPPGPTTTSPAPGDPYAAGPCPDARTCTERKLLAGRWPRGSDGTTTIHYRVNPDGSIHNRFTPDQVVASVQRAFQTWADAVPRLRFVYDGTTTDKPGGGNNVIGFGPLTYGIGQTLHTPAEDAATFTGFWVTLSNTYTFTYRPCQPPADPCTDDDNLGADLQALLTHEIGRVIGLTDPANTVTGAEQTMAAGGNGGDNRRAQCTLAKGDVIGAREVTATPKADPMPPIYWP